VRRSPPAASPLRIAEGIVAAATTGQPVQLAPRSAIPAESP